MRKSAVQHNQVLSEIKLGFLMFRRDRGGKRSQYSKPVQALAISGLARGCTPSEVARAAGVSEGSIRNWRKSKGSALSISQKARPLELKLVESREAFPTSLHDRGLADASPATTGTMAHIEFRSGARMTVPVSALTEQLISLLMGGAE
jgi:hypothetical protein